MFWKYLKVWIFFRFPHLFLLERVSSPKVNKILQDKNPLNFERSFSFKPYLNDIILTTVKYLHNLLPNIEILAINIECVKWVMDCPKTFIRIQNQFDLNFILPLKSPKSFGLWKLVSLKKLNCIFIWMLLTIEGS